MYMYYNSLYLIIMVYKITFLFHQRKKKTWKNIKCKSICEKDDLTTK